MGAHRSPAGGRPHRGHRRHGLRVVEPRPDRYFPSILTVAREKASASSRMVERATVVNQQAAAAMDALIADKPTRDRLKQAYFDRLVRSDLGSALRAALTRRDPEIHQLLTAVADFLGSVPPKFVESPAVTNELLVPPASAWRSLSPAARSAYWAMHQVAARNDLRGVGRAGWAFLPAFALIRALPGQRGRAGPSALLWMGSLVTVALGRVVRRPQVR